MSKIPNNKNNNSFKKSVLVKEPNMVKKPFIEKDKIEKMSQERILQKNVVYVIGLSYKLANKEILQKTEYFGQYGNIQKVLTNKTKGLAQNSYYENCYSSYIYYSNPVEASLAILAVDNFKIENHYLKTSFGRTKYCSYFLRNLECLNKDCFYLHKLADKDDIITGDDSKLLFHEQHIQAIKIANLLDANFKKKISTEEAKKNYETVFPKVSVIYSKPVFIEFQSEFNSSNNISNISLVSNGVSSNTKLSLNSIVNGNKNKDDKTKINNNNNTNKDTVLNNSVVEKKEVNDEYDELGIGNNLNSEVDCNLNCENPKNKEPTQGLKLADILRNEKKPKHNSPQKLKLADIINKKTASDKKINTVNTQKKTEINIANSNVNSNENNINNKNITSKDCAILNQKIPNLISKEPNNLKKQESDLINLSSNLTDNSSLKQKGKLSEASNYSTEEKAINESEFNSKSSAAGSIKNPIDNDDLELNNNSEDSANIVNNTVEEDIINNSNNNNMKENKENEKARDICISPQKAFKNAPGHKTPKSKEQIISEVNKKYIKIHQEENTSSANQHKNSNDSNTLNVNNLQKNRESNSTNNHNKTSNNPELQYFIDSGKSDPRSSIISSTSCSVSPNISYNQEIENHLSSNIISSNNKSDCKASDFSEKRRSIYTKRDISRFDFVLNNPSANKANEISESRKNSENNNNNINNNNKENEKLDHEIPEFVFDVLNKKISRFSFFKRFKNEYDISDSIFLEDSFIDKNKDESWADFIKMNLNA